MGARANRSQTSFDSLPNLVVIGAMKCGTSALHRYLDLHPEIAMSDPKELNFFYGPDGHLGDAWHPGNWRRGSAWYASHWPGAAPVRGESSPGYTSPSHIGVAERMAALIPSAKLVYLVRDPVDRALSQYRHHVAEGTEGRAPEEALLDPASQYVPRGRYFDRVRPFLEVFPRDRIAIVSREELLTERRMALRTLFDFLEVDASFWSDGLNLLWHTSNGGEPRLCTRLQARLAEAFVDDANRLRELSGRAFPGWSV
jgi:sulfotransferase family protein